MLSSSRSRVGNHAATAGNLETSLETCGGRTGCRPAALARPFAEFRHHGEKVSARQCRRFRRPGRPKNRPTPGGLTHVACAYGRQSYPCADVAGAFWMDYGSDAVHPVLPLTGLLDKPIVKPQLLAGDGVFFDCRRGRSGSRRRAAVHSFRGQHAEQPVRCRRKSLRQAVQAVSSSRPSKESTRPRAGARCCGTDAIHRRSSDVARRRLPDIATRNFVGISQRNAYGKYGLTAAPVTTQPPVIGP